MTWLCELWRTRWTRGSDDRDFELRLSISGTGPGGSHLRWHVLIGEYAHESWYVLSALSYPLTVQGYERSLGMLRFWSSDCAGPVRACVPESGAVDLVAQAEGLSDYARSMALHWLDHAPAPRHGSCYETLIGGGARAGAFAFA